jgi:K+-sensing histidine kinase KdpD
MFKRDQRHIYRFWRSAAQFLFGVVVLVLLTYVCFQFQANSTKVALLYLIVIVVVSLKSSFIPATFVSIVAYICLDIFFTAPLFRPAMREPLDVVAPVAFLTTSFIWLIRPPARRRGKGGRIKYEPYEGITMQTMPINLEKEIRARIRRIA